jgi:hypothetical protein
VLEFAIFPVTFKTVLLPNCAVDVAVKYTFTHADTPNDVAVFIVYITSIEYVEVDAIFNVPDVIVCVEPRKPNVNDIVDGFHTVP